MSLYKAGKVYGVTQRQNSPKVTPLPLGRLQVVRRFDVHTHEAGQHKNFNTSKPEDLTIEIFGGFGLLDGTNVKELPAPENWSDSNKHEAYKDCRLIDEIFDPGQDNKWILTQVYETLTSEWVQEDVDKRSERNGLGVITRVLVARRNTPPPALDAESKITIDGTDYFFSAKEDDSSDRKGRIILTYVEPGILSVETDRASPKQRITVQAIGLAWDDIKDSITDVGANHRLINDGISDYEGLQTHSYTFEVSGAEEITIGENGLRGVTRYEFSETPFSREGSGEVGTHTISHRFEDAPDPLPDPDVDGDIDLTLAQVKVNNLAPLKTRTRTWVQKGILSIEQDLISPKQTVTVTAIGLAWDEISDNFSDEVTGDHFRIKEGIGDYSGLQTNTFTFELNGYTETELGKSGLKQITVVEYSESTFTEFNVGVDDYENTINLPSPPPSPLPDGVHFLSYQKVNNTSPVKRRETRWVQKGILSVRTPKVGGQQRVVVSAVGMTESEVSDALAAVTNSHLLIDESAGDYEGLVTASFTYEVKDFVVVEYTETGLKLTTRTQLSATTLGELTFTTKYPANTGDPLSGQVIDNGGAIKKRVSTYAQVGLLDAEERAGPASLPGTKRITYISQGLPFHPVQVGATSEWEPKSTPAFMPGSKARLDSKKDTNANGFTRYIRTYLVAADATKTITGEKYSYSEYVDVPVLGELEGDTISAGLSGSSVSSDDIAILITRPRTTKEILSDVTITIYEQDSLPNAPAKAFNTSVVSCSVVVTNVNHNVGTGATLTFGPEGTEQTLTGWNQNIGVSGNSREYDGYKLVGPNATSGAINYDSSANPVLVDGSGNSQMSSWDINTASSKSTVTITQAGDPALFVETGMIRRRPRPVYTTSDGTTYWEVIRWDTP